MAELKYTEDHEWVAVDGDVVSIGITGYAQEALGDLVFVELPEVGKKVGKGDDFAVVESVKTAAEVYSPVAGEVVEVNVAMADDLELIKKPANENGWIARIKIEDPSELEGLMDESKYKEFTDGLD
ncbi:MAG: glycine cleavage system H protein [Micavibrio sp.]|nr:MAG: glycine cleavage system H protein [Micavibrio sp.]